MSLPAGVRARMALRLSLLQATWNYERQQGLGWAFAIAPALERAVADPAERRARLAEHTAYFNTQPTLASVALGAVAALEEQRGAGAGPDADGIARVKAVLGSSLAALGDRVFWLTLRPFAACLGVVLAIAGNPYGALALWLGYNVVHQGVRWQGVSWGYRDGPAAAAGALRERLERLARVLGVIGSALIGVIVAALMAPGGDPAPLTWQIVLGAGLALGLIASQRARPTPTEWALGAGALCLAAAWWRPA
jgi:mannose/fructose/N-acetylgalactosamine-specific phosphotransferase system component IID